MTAKCFVDTNIILYASGHDPAEKTGLTKEIERLSKIVTARGSQTLEREVRQHRPGQHRGRCQSPAQRGQGQTRRKQASAGGVVSLGDRWICLWDRRACSGLTFLLAKFTLSL